MKQLNYKTLKETGYNGFLLKEAPERIMQIGEGNFLRAFVDYFIDQMNEKAEFNTKIVVVQPIPKQFGEIDVKQAINDQEGLYNLYLRGYHNHQTVIYNRVISCISRCLNIYDDFEDVMRCALNPDLRFIISNTTEAGIVFNNECKITDQPATTFPAKLTQFLYRRYKQYGSIPGKGFIILACELSDDNGKVLKEYVLRYASLWKLENSFIQWIKKENTFCSTLVDRIVTGYPVKEAIKINEQNGYEDRLIDMGEIFASWVIEGPQSLQKELPFEKANLPVLICEDHKPYKERKVRILNGSHTSFVLGAYLAGKSTVRDCMDDKIISGFITKIIFKEIIPTLSLEEDECRSFANSVIERFKNPFIEHKLLNISLNSTSKWKTRVLPSLIKYIDSFARLPQCITASFAFYIQFYRGSIVKNNRLLAQRKDGQSYMIVDDLEVLMFFQEYTNRPINELVHAVCSQTDFWDMNLSEIPDFESEVIQMLEMIESRGAYALMELCLR